MRAGEQIVYCNAGPVDGGCCHFGCSKRVVSPDIVRDTLIVADLTEDCADYVPARTWPRGAVGDV